MVVTEKTHRDRLLCADLPQHLQNSNCVGDRVKAPSDAVVGRSSRKHSSRRPLYKEWWATNSDEMDNNIPNSRSSQQTTPTVTEAGPNQESRTSNSNANGTAFVNHALLLWQERRREWVGSRQDPRPQVSREPVLSCTTMTYDGLLTSSCPFARPIPLPEMVDYLVDVWEQEGLYDN